MEATDIGALLDERFSGVERQPSAHVTPQLAGMIGRRSIRRFMPEKIGKDVIDVLLAAAFSAPSKSDYQQATVIQIESQATRDALVKAISLNPWLADAPHFMIFCADTHRLKALAASKDRPHPNNDLEAFFNATVMAALVMQAFITAAESVGLGCCPVSAVRNHLDVIGPLLALPAGVVPVAGLAFGKPLDRGRVSMRLPQSVTVHVDRYDAAGQPGKIKQYDAARLASLSGAPAQQTDWSTSKVEQMVSSDSRKFTEFVRTSGFKL